MSTKSKTKRVKSKITKLIEKSDSENEENTHELSFYVDDRVKLMKEVLKIIKPKKIKAMAPECIKDLDIEEINSMLLEELLGISNKRLKYIFNGQNPAEDSSSTDSEEEKQPIDIISLDDISDDDFVIDVDSDKPIRKKKKSSSNSVPKPKKIKKEKHDKKKDSEKLQEDNLMSVLELLELQARARAIRSQLMIEGSKKKKSEETAHEIKSEDDSDEEAVIIQSPKNEEIIITSSDSDSEEKKEESTCRDNLQAPTNGEQNKKKIKLNRQKFNDSKTASEENVPNDDSPAIIETVREITENSTLNDKPPSIVEEGEVVDEPTCSKHSETVPETQAVVDTSEVTTETVKKPEEKKPVEDDDDDAVILIVDQDEIDGIIGID